MITNFVFIKFAGNSNLNKCAGFEKINEKNHSNS